jgi:hypothetical protein
VNSASSSSRACQTPSSESDARITGTSGPA